MALMRWAIAVIVMTAATSSALAQTLGQGKEDPVSLWRVAASLLLCLILAVIGGFALKSRGLGRGAIGPLVRRDRRLELIDSLRLPNQTDLCLVKCDGRIMLLATSAQGLQILPLDSAPPTEMPGT